MGRNTDIVKNLRVFWTSVKQRFAFVLEPSQVGHSRHSCKLYFQAELGSCFMGRSGMKFYCQAVEC